MATSLST